MATRTQSQPILRQIYFYRMSDILELWQKPQFTPALLEQDLLALPDEARYYPVNDEYDLCLLSEGQGAFQFGKARKTDMARVVANGRVKQLRLPRGEKLFDCIHVLFFPSGLVGAEFNLFGPRMTSLTDYLVSKLTSCAPVTFDRLVYGDVLERLNRVHEVKAIELRVDTARTGILTPFGNGWIDSGNWMKEQYGVGSIELTLRAGLTAHRPLREHVKEAIRDMLSGSNLRDATDKFKIRAVMDGSDLTISIDLLEDKLMTTVEIPRDIYRNPDRYREYIYQKIRGAYSALREDIMQAARIVS